VTVEAPNAVMIIVTYNSYAALPNLIESIREFHDDHAGNHVMVVENSSDPRVGELVRSHLASHRVHVEIAPRNDGFSHGVNLGYEAARERWGRFAFVVLLNPDVLSAGHTVSELVNRARRHRDSDIGVWGAVLRDEDGHIDRGCARRVWNTRRFFAHLAGCPGLTKVLATPARTLSEREIASDQKGLAMVSGALVCIRSDVFGEGLDTLLPMYLEDQEICLRSARMGLSVRLHGDLEAVHLGGVSRKSASHYEQALRIMELVESPVQCMRRFHGYPVAWLRLVVMIGGLARLMASPAVAVVKATSGRARVRDEVIWTSDQWRMATWFMSWAISGKCHRDDVALTEYFDEYLSKGAVTSPAGQPTGEVNAS
jgi:N-acetylglucosaminyl-diphospho-decaprenol L-rhamnosyltransferase